MRTFSSLFPSATEGSGGGMSAIPVGGLVMFPDHFPEMVEQNGATFSRSGYLVTDPTKFDPAVFTTPHLPLGTYTGIHTNIGRPVNQVIDGVWYRTYPSGGSSGNKIQRSTDGLNWTDVTIANPSTRGYTPILKMDGLWLVGCQWGGGTPEYYWTSTDGVTWVRRTSPWSMIYGASDTNYPNGGPVKPLFVFRGRIYVSTMRRGTFGFDEVYSTTDGTTWRKETLPDTTISNVAATQAWVDGTRIAAFSASTNDSPSTQGLLYTLDGSTWLQANWPGNGTGNGHALGWIDGKFELFARDTSGSNAQGGLPTIFRTTDFSSWTIERTPYENDFFPGTKQWMISENQYINVQETLAYAAGWYWLSTTFEPGTIYMSKTGKNWIKRAVHTGSNNYYPGLPVALGNKLLFNDVAAIQGPNGNVLVTFDQSIISAGAGVRYTEGSFVQYMRIK